MLFLTLCLLLTGVLCESDDDLGYSLNIGNAIDVFANYGDLSQVIQVLSADYEEESDEPAEPFREKNIRVFENISSVVTPGDTMVDMNIQLFETFEELLHSYFQNFNIEGIDAPWQAFMGDWIVDEISRAFGIDYDTTPDNCCYVLVKLTKAQKTVKIDLQDARVKDYVQWAIERLNVTDPAEVRRFMKSYGTHYIDSYVTGNCIYQVFKYKRSGFNLLKSYIRLRERRRSNSDSLRFYFSSYFLKQVGEIRIASGNKTVEHWARKNLKDSQYLFSRPSLLRLHYNRILAFQLNSMLDNGALLSITLKTLKPLFKDRYKAEKFSEIVENDLKLWEANA